MQRELVSGAGLGPTEQPGSPPQPTGRGWLPLILVIMGATFLRLVLADKESYWLDELFSVQQYVLAADGLGDALSDLALTSIHPPLYQTLLYGWVEVFGPGEVSTRTLSNLAIALAMIALYRFASLLHGRRIAVGAVAVFGLSYGSVIYGLETRSYALTLLLATVSSLMAVHYLRTLSSANGLRRLMPGWAGVGFLLANVALLLVHYYNLFYWASQGLLLIILAGWIAGPGRRLEHLPAVVIAYTLQLLIVVAVWGREFLAQFGGYRGMYAVDNPDATAVVMLTELIRHAYAIPGVPGLVTFAVVLGFTFHRVSRAFSAQDQQPTAEAIGATYAVWMATVPAVVTWAVFLALGEERFVPRYLIFMLPHLATLGGIAGVHMSELVGQVAVRRRDGGLPRWRDGAAAGTGLALFLLAVVPGTYAAATESKADWRGISAQAVALIRGAPDRQYVIYQTSFRPDAMSDFYLGRASDGEVQAHGVITRIDEAARDFAFEQEPPEHEGADGIIVLFLHHTTDQFPAARDRLARRYEEELVLLDEEGRGIVTYQIAE